MPIFDDVLPVPKAKRIKARKKPGPRPKPEHLKAKAIAAKKREEARGLAKKTQRKIHYSKTALAKHTRAKERQVKKVASIDKATRVLEGEDAVVIPDELKNLPKAIKEQLADKEIVFRPHDGPQTDFLSATEREVFFGGARGGGKSFAMLVDPLRYCDNKYHSGLLLRRTMPELRDLIEQSKDLYPKAYPNARWYKQESEWRFPSGARQLFGYAETPADALRYQGQQYNWIGVDELPQYETPEIWNKLRGSLRSAHGLPLYMRATGNPGNIGSYWVKDMFIDAAPPNQAFQIKVNLPDGRTAQFARRFIPATLKDNPALLHNDDYLIMLASLPPIQRQQWLDGDWSAFDNRAFPEFNRPTHVVEPFEIPNSWPRFRACDYGYAAPAAVLWFAIDFDNNLIVYRELYERGLTADRLAAKVLELDELHTIKYGVLDSSTWAKRGDVGPSIAETMNRIGCRWRPSDRSRGSRTAGKVEVHRRLASDPILKKPRLQIMSHCPNTIRTMEMLPTDKNNPEDADTHAEDHAYDALRYGCMSRPLHRYQDANFLERFKESIPNVADSRFGY